MPATRARTRPVGPVRVAGPTPGPAAAGRSGHQLLIAALAGLAVGSLTSFGQTLLGGTALAGLGNAVSPWLAVPFAVGMPARRDAHAAVLGLLACVAQVPGYYLASDLRGFGVSTAMVGVWVVAGVLGGPLLGWAGRSWRTATGRLRGAGPALVVGAWASEAVVTHGFVLGYGDHAAVFGAVSVLLAVVLGVAGRQLRALLAWLPVACLLGAAGFAVLHAVL
jgi:Family of unknown function (DUF6518)